MPRPGCSTSDDFHLRLKAQRKPDRPVGTSPPAKAAHPQREGVWSAPGRAVLRVFRTPPWLRSCGLATSVRRQLGNDAFAKDRIAPRS